MHSRSDEHTLLTGATGFIGQYVLAALLRRGMRCATIVRPPLADAERRIDDALAALDVDGPGHRADGRLVLLAGDLNGALPDAPGVRLARVIHVAASTRFQPDGTGDPQRTNVGGTQRLLEWCSAQGVRELHVVSSAYVCGRMAGPVPEAFVDSPPDFHNEYEQSKWRAEQLARAWAAAGPRTLTVYRPSVVVGEFERGRAARFAGFYVAARATELLDRRLADADAATRRAVPLRIRGRAQDRQNIVPVDYVADLIVGIVARPSLHGHVYHVAHPSPPTNAEIKTALEEHFGVAGGRFIAPEQTPTDDWNEYERQFYDVSRPVEHYFVDTPTFQRARADAAEAEVGVRCPTYDVAALRRLLAYAQQAQWGRRPASVRGGASPCATYFERFLPRYVAQSRVARLTALTTTMRFVIEDEPNGEWVCRFDRGQLRAVHRGVNGVHEAFGYRTTRDVFWEAIGGRVHPQELFLSGRAELLGDVEQALKMAMILYAFAQEFPCDATQLAGMESAS